MLSRIFILFTLLAITGCGPCHSLPPLFQNSSSYGKDEPPSLLGLLPTPQFVPTLLLFIQPDCPISNAYAPEIERITREYQPEGITVYLVHCDPSVTLEAARKHAEEYGMTARILLDPKLELADAVGATITPEAVFTSHGVVHYLGRIDDRYVSPGVNREVITKRDLRDAMDAYLAGDPIKSPRVAAVGCYISRD